MRESTFAVPLTLGVLDRVVNILCRGSAVFELLSLNFGFMRRSAATRADLKYTAGEMDGRRAFYLTRGGQPRLVAGDDGEFIYLFEKDLTVELQRLRRDLYFVHAAALELFGRAVLLVAPSGQGKSTTAWGLLNRGFGYLSDELAAVNLQTMGVGAYPHALCLKAPPPGPCPLPKTILRTSRTLHVPAHLLTPPTVAAPVPLAAIFFLVRAREADATPAVASISKAEAAARLFAQALNPLAHTDDGLQGALAIASRAACYRLYSADLGATCELINEELVRLLTPERQALRTGDRAA